MTLTRPTTLVRRLVAAHGPVLVVAIVGLAAVLAGCSEPVPAAGPGSRPGSGPGSTGTALAPRTTPPVVPAPTTFTLPQATALAIAAHVAASGSPQVGPLGGALEVCGTSGLGIDLARSTLVRSRAAPTATGLVASASVTAAYPDARTASARVDPVVAALSRCRHATTESDGTPVHETGSASQVAGLAGRVARVLRQGAADGTPTVTIELTTRIANLLVACEAEARSAGVAERAARACLTRMVSSAAVPLRPSPPVPDATIDPVVARTLVARMPAPSGTARVDTYDTIQTCVIAPSSTVVRATSADGLDLGFASAADSKLGVVSAEVVLLPEASATRAVQVAAREQALALGCSGPLRSTNPRMVPTVATGHGILPGKAQGAFVAWEERYAGGTSYHVQEVSRVASVVVLTSGQASTAVAARQRADSALASALAQLGVG